uniref:OmpA/MotB domain protein n=1 Tax=Psychrobacter sp. (strain PRwf-1) TaxID=349106 RepID=A5WEE5_PSYWF
MTAIRLSMFFPVLFIGLSGCVSTGSNSSGDIRHVDGITWNKQTSVSPSDFLSKKVEADEVRLVFIRDADDYSEQTSSNISINNRFQVSLQEGGYTTVNSCVGINQLSAHATGYKDNDLLADKRSLDLAGGNTYYFLVTVEGDGKSYISQIKDSGQAFKLLQGKRYQSHQISRVVPNCPRPVITEAAEVVTAAPVAPVLKEKVTIDLEVLFETDKSVVRPSYYRKLSEVADFMNKYPSTIATIEGHTDDRASDSYNLALSQRRADAVRNVFIHEFDIDSNRLKAIGYGESKPRATNDTAEGRQLNRRVMAVIEEN